jgi:catecholate siderophore receptor
MEAHPARPATCSTCADFNASNSLFVDGVRDDGLISRNVYNVEQVEVFLGPAGSDVGRGTASGYVNMATKTPGAETSTSDRCRMTPQIKRERQWT